jgi:hypothetical protein
MRPGPPKWMERVVGFVLPSDYREQVLGDLHERYRNPAQYAWDALRTVPLVIWSHTHRTFAMPNSPRPQTAGGGGMSPEDVRRKADHLRSKALRGTLWMFVAVVLVVALSLRIGTIHSLAPSVTGFVLAIAVYLAFQVYRKRPGPKVPLNATLATATDFYRRELERQRDSGRKIWLWYVGPLLALMTAPIVAQFWKSDEAARWWNAAPFICLTLIWGLSTSRLAQREAQRIQRELDDLDRPGT